MTSCQEFTKFENEVKLIPNLHRNLTTLLGYCINGAEKFLVYEFRSNYSLHKVIFGRKSYITFFLFIIVRVVLLLKRKKFGSIRLKFNSYFCTCPDPTGRGTVTWPIHNVILGIGCNFSAVQKFETRASFKNIAVDWLCRKYKT